jgi:hypothetical protein
MPKIEMSMDLISADPEAMSSRNVENRAIVFVISSPSVNAEKADS